MRWHVVVWCGLGCFLSACQGPDPRHGWDWICHHRQTVMTTRLRNELRHERVGEGFRGFHATPAWLAEQCRVLRRSGSVVDD